MRGISAQYRHTGSVCCFFQESDSVYNRTPVALFNIQSDKHVETKSKHKSQWQGSLTSRSAFTCDGIHFLMFLRSKVFLMYFESVHIRCRVEHNYCLTCTHVTALWWTSSFQSGYLMQYMMIPSCKALLKRTHEYESGLSVNRWWHCHLYLWFVYYQNFGSTIPWERLWLVLVGAQRNCAFDD